MTAAMPHLDQVTRAQIVVVDPKQSDYDELLRLAVADGCGVRVLTTGRAALRQWREVRAGLLIISVELPDLNGFDLVEMLQPFPKGTIVFLVANRYAVEDEVRALRLGVNGFLCKPLAGLVLCQCLSIRSRRSGTPSLACVAEDKAYQQMNCPASSRASGRRTASKRARATTDRRSWPPRRDNSAGE